MREVKLCQKLWILDVYCSSIDVPNTTDKFFNMPLTGISSSLDSFIKSELCEIFIPTQEKEPRL